MDPLARLFGSAARLKLLRLFLFNEGQAFPASEIVTRTKTPKDTVRRELAALIAANVIRKRSVKGGPQYTVNARFPHLYALTTFLRTTTSLGDTEMLASVKRAGTLRLVVLSGMFTGAVETKIDMLIVGDRLNEKALENSVHKLEAELGRELSYATFSTEDFKYRVSVYDRLIRDVLDYPNRILLDRIGLERQ
ncbi:MAG TPA: hypothetical protein VF696_00300 [Candidatus Paceibacterota bacterium]|jgi:hypothetical protein